MIGVYSLLLLIVGAVMQKQGFYGTVVRPLLEGRAVPVHYVRSWGARAEWLVLDVAMQDLRRLEFQASQALVTGVLESRPDDSLRPD